MAIIDGGREIQAKRIILLVGEELFGPADESTKTRVQAITDIDRLERIFVKLPRCGGWQEALETA
jgi:hypothetical protein